MKMDKFEILHKGFGDPKKAAKHVDAGLDAAYGLDPITASEYGAVGFGFKHKQIYADPLGYGELGIEIDHRPAMKAALRAGVESKAFDSQEGGAGTAGYAMIPVYVDPMITDQSRKYTPLVEMLPKAANLGTTADFNVLTAKGAAQFLAEDPALAEQDDTFDRSSKAIKYAYAVGRVTGVAQAAVPPYQLQAYNPQGTGLPGTTFGSSGAPNAKALSVLVKSRAMFELLENKILNGSSSTDTNEIDGIRTQVGTTNTVDKNSTAITLDDIDTAVSYAVDDGGRPNLAICDTKTYREIQALLRDGQRTVPKMDIFGIGRIVLDTMVGEIPLIFSQFATTTDGSRRLDLVDTTVWEQRYLMDVTYEDLAKTGDAEKFMLKTYMALICRAVAFNASVTEIS